MAIGKPGPSELPEKPGHRPPTPAADAAGGPGAGVGVGACPALSSADGVTRRDSA